MATDKSKKSSIVETAKKRFALAEECESEIRALALEDWKFRAGDQWPQEIKNERESDHRPVLVINKILQSIRQVTNDQRQNRPSIKVHPVDDAADIETAKIYQGIIRHIEQDSGADVAYDTAFEGAAVGGFGYLRVFTEYVDPTAFEQQIKIGDVDNPFSVYFDPNSKRPDGSDANWAFIVEDVPKDDYEAEYGDTELAKTSDWEGLGDTADWVRKDTCRIAEYFYKEFKNVEVAQLNNGRVVELQELKKLYPEGVPDGMVVNQKKAKVPVIKWVKLNGLEILEETEWPGRYIPIIPVYGDKFVLEGKRILEGIVRHAKDPQRMYNYWKSTETETITLAPKAPFIAAEGQIPKQYEAQWKTANKKSHAYLTYKPTTLENHLVPPPQRNFGDVNVQAITQAGMFAADDIKGTTGIYDAALGAQSNETSGIAIQRRNMQAQTSNFHLIDNLTRSIRHTGKILVDLIPKIYDTARAARIIGEEGEEEIVRINEEFEFRGEKVHYKMGVGKYDVSVDTGPSYATKRQEAAQSLLELSKVAPQLMQVAPDLMVKSLDIPFAQDLAERLKKTVPAGTIDEKDKKPIPPEVQAQLEQMSQMVEQLTTNLNDATKTIDEKRMELESKERIEFAKLENELLIEKMKLAGQGAQFQIEAQLRELQMRQKMVGISQPIDTGLNQPPQQPNQEFIGPDQAEMETQEQPPTGGISPGFNMEGQ